MDNNLIYVGLAVLSLASFPEMSMKRQNYISDE